MTDVVGVKIGLGLGGLFGRSAELEKERTAHGETKAQLTATKTQLADAKELLRQQSSRLEVVRTAFSSSDSDIWLREPMSQPDTYHDLSKGIPILVFANLKGGVAKSTLVSNLAAYFESMGERVLVIDLDFQGSSTSMLASDFSSSHLADASIAAIGPNFDPERLLHHAQAIRSSKQDSRLITCGKAFATHETALSLKWLIGDITDDIRYYLAKLLLSAAVQRNFSRVIIDTPPRATTGFVNALCASTHLFIPTVLDQLSTDGVTTFLGDYDRLKGRLFPQLRLCGILGTLKRNGGEKMMESESNAIIALKRTLVEKTGYDHYLWEEHLMPRNEAFAKAAGVRVAFPETSVFKIVSELGEKIDQKAPSRERAKI